MIDGEVFVNGQLTAGLIITANVSIIYLVIRMITSITKIYFVYQKAIEKQRRDLHCSLRAKNGK